VPAPRTTRRLRRPAAWEPQDGAVAPAPAARRINWQVILAFAAIVAIVSALVALFAVELWLSDRVMPGVFVWNIDLGGLTRDEAAARLAADFRYPDDRVVTLRYGDQQWAVDPGELGT